MNRQQIEDKIKAFLVDELEIEEDKITPEAKLKEDLEIDSLGYVDLVVIVDKTFGFKINATEMAGVETLEQFVDYVEEKLKEK